MATKPAVSDKKEAMDEDWKEKLRIELAPLDDDNDRQIAEDIVGIFLANCEDKEYGVPGLIYSFEHKPGFKLHLVPGLETYAIAVFNRVSISMRTMAKQLMMHSSMYDVIVDNDSHNGEAVNMTTHIKIWRSTVVLRSLFKFTPSRKVHINNKMTGLIMNKASKKDAREIMQDILDMEPSGMWSPNWKNDVCADGKSYIIIASPIRRVSLSFFKYLSTKHRGVLQNVLLTRDVIDGNIPCVRVTIRCNIRQPEAGEEDDDEDEEEAEEDERTDTKGAPTPINDVMKRGKERAMGIARLPISKHKKPTKNSGWSLMGMLGSIMPKTK